MSEWVSVKYPPDLGSGFYLVWTDNAGVEKCRWSESRKKWMGGSWTQHITHWRPMLASPTKVKTNADKIRSLDDEELAWFLTNWARNKQRTWCVCDDILEWLGEEPEEIGDERRH